MSAAAKHADMNFKIALKPRVEKPVIDYPAYRREPGGLTTAVLLAVGDGYDTSLKIANLLNTSIDNVNGALGRLLSALYVSRWGFSPVTWTITDAGRRNLRAVLWEDIG